MTASIRVPEDSEYIICSTGAADLTADDFDPQKHLAFKKPSKIWSMKDISLPENHGISPIAVSEPFRLFSDEAVRRMRAEVLAPEVMDNCQYSSTIAAAQLRGYANKYAPFVYDAWKHPETLAVISKIAGVELVTALDFEIGHVNLTVKTKEQTQQELQGHLEQTHPHEDEGYSGIEIPSERPIVDWHRDSYPFVCVLMLSDCTNMIGGETALRTGTGDVTKVRGPEMGCAVVLQGRYIEHQALRALGATERITMVTSFRPANPLLRDDTVLNTVRQISNLTDLYSQFSDYRFEMLQHRLRHQQTIMQETKSRGKKLDVKQLKHFIKEQEAFLRHMDKEIVEEGAVLEEEQRKRDVLQLKTKAVQEIGARPAKKRRRG